MHPLSYLHFQMQLEGTGLNGNRLFKEAGVAPDEDLPLMLIAQLRTREVIAYYDESMPDGLQNRLAERLHEIQFPHMEPLLKTLDSYGLRAEAGHYKTYLFPTPPPGFTDRIAMRYTREDPRVQAFGFGGFAEHVFGIEQQGQLIAACVSARENEHCGEAWVHTDPKYRRQGFGKRVVNAWARSLMNAGKIPFYSCKIDNPASIAMAQNLGLQLVFEEINIAAT